MSEDTKSDAFTRELKSRIGNAPEPNCVTNTEVLKLIAMLRDRISTINILQACVASAEQDLAAQATLMTEDEIVEAMWREIDRVPATSTLREGIRAAYHIAREQALREAARICDAVNNHDNPMTARDCADAILALIPCRQEPR